jgi:sugar lactone lactonase YvrE
MKVSNFTIVIGVLRPIISQATIDILVGNERKARAMIYLAESIPDTSCDLGEGALWDERNQSFYWSDVFHGLIWSYHPESKKLNTKKFANLVSFLCKASDSGYVVATDTEVVIVNSDFSVRQRTSMNFSDPDLMTNDGGIDPTGNLWAGTMSRKEVAGAGTLLRLVGTEWTTEVAATTISNGMDWSLDGRILYFIDSPTKKISRFAFNPETGKRGDELPSIDLSSGTGIPDGMCVDADGNLWVALWGGGEVRCFSPAGNLVNTVSLPVTHVTNCAFGGPNLTTLFITTASDSYDPRISPIDPLSGSLFQVKVDTKGRAARELMLK